MKVLFAVNSESISDAIIKKYQKDYREILSYKNVYYFNAIQKEIQKDKSYDRIVISEDLEPFSNNNYESIDKFIFEKLDGISDEAHDAQGNEISIILISSDRHTKGSSFLVKLFGIGIYNALLGTDRSMEEVCRLIHKPRTKKEAKMYYKIDTDDVSYRAESENEVSELEIQNIIAHFKKLGKRSEKYVGSFEKIASQYSDEQLKIIINCLPINVKAILEDVSPKYQDIMAINGRFVKGIKNRNAAGIEDQKRTGLKIDIIENKKNQAKMTKPIVIPNSVKATKSATAKKIVSVQPNAENASTKTIRKVQPTDQAGIAKTQPIANQKSQVKTVKPVRKNVNTPVKKKIEIPSNDPFDELENIELPDLELGNETKRNDEMLASHLEKAESTPKRRGRPRKIQPEQEISKPKGKRGRPRKTIEPNLEMEEGQLDMSLLDMNQELEDFSPNVAYQNEKTSVDFEEFENDEIEEFDDFQDEEETYSEEVALPELDDLEDISEVEDDTFNLDSEESFDEFEDYDEYGKYQTKTQHKNFINDADEMYEDDILSGFDEELEQINTNDEISEFDEFGDEQYEEDDGNQLISDLEEEPNLLSVDSYEDEFDMDSIEDENEYQEDLSRSNPYENVQNNFAEPSYEVQDNYGINKNSLESISSQIDYSMSNLNSLMTKDKKIVTFLGSPKNGVSFLVNNLAEIFASVGINTAILDMTKNKNSYYIYTQNEESLRQIAYTSLEDLQEGTSNGIRVKQNLTVYTALPNDGKDYSNAEPILSTLVQNHSLVLIDCDFDTNPSYFASCQEIYLVQSMDILTIQPLTAFLRELKTQGVLEPEKVRVVINKEMKVKGLTNKAIIGGMSFYNDPAMSFMTELFNKELVKYCSIPFEEMAYSRYLEGMLNCKVSVNGYSKNMMNKLRVLGDMVYPLTSRQTYSSKSQVNYNNGPEFSSSMKNTLNKMKKKY